MTRLILRLYPARWRARYGDELAALLAETGLGPRTWVDLVRGGLRERVRPARNGGITMKLEPAWRHPGRWSAAAALLILPTALVVGLSLLAHELGVTPLTAWVDPMMRAVDAARPVDLYLVVAPLLGLAVALAPLVRLDLTDGEARIAIRARAANLAVAVVALGLGLLLIGHIVTESVLRAGS
jgi:hypothetical protein